MCGIAGFIGEDRGKIENMTKSLIHRGPDGNAVHVGNGISLGHARLAILDPRPEGDQPMWNEDRTVVIVYNGEIFNYRRIVKEENLTCRTTTDTEVLLKLYEKYGIGFVSKLLGMFAFSLYDTRCKTWYLARDPSGIKPLFIAFPEQKLHFASEMRALMHVLPKKPEINLTSLSHFLKLQYVPGPKTLCEEIESLEPGSVLTWSNGRAVKTMIAAKVEPVRYKSKGEFSENFPILMDEVVKDHLISDKPVGIFLSGGMDSSVLLHHMVNHAEKPVRTFTVSFDATKEEGSERFNTDAELAKLTAKHYGTEHEDVHLTAETCKNIYRDAARALDQPNADSVAPAQFLLSSVAKKKVDVVLAGAGGDELFGGYPRYRIARILHASRMIPGGLRGLTGKLLGYPSDVLRMSPGSDLAERLLARPNSEILNLTTGDWFLGSATRELFHERFSLIENHTSVRQFMEFDRHLWLVDESLRLADAMTMAHGLEARIPFLDPRIIAASLGTDDAWHVTLQKTKALIKETYRTILPEHLFTLPKSSFYPPLAKWIRRECAPLVEEMLESQRIAEYFDMKAIRTVFEKHKTGEKYGLHQLSNLIQLHSWFETVYDA